MEQQRDLRARPATALAAGALAVALLAGCAEPTAGQVIDRARDGAVGTVTYEISGGLATVGEALTIASDGERRATSLTGGILGALAGGELLSIDRADGSTVTCYRRDDEPVCQEDGSDDEQPAPLGDLGHDALDQLDVESGEPVEIAGRQAWCFEVVDDDRSEVCLDAATGLMLRTSLDPADDEAVAGGIEAVEVDTSPPADEAFAPWVEPQPADEVGDPPGGPFTE